MMKKINSLEFRQNLDHLLDEIVNTGVSIPVERNGTILEIKAVKKTSKLDQLVLRPDFIVGNVDDFVNVSWEGEINFDLY